MDSLAFRNARQHVRTFASETDDLMTRHAKAMDCRDCEDYLQVGIDAYMWLSRFDARIRRAIAAGKVKPDGDGDEGIANLYRLWLKSYESAEKWVADLLKDDFQVDNLAKLRQCAEALRAVVRENEKMDELASRVPSAESLDFIVIQPPREWLEEPPCAR